MWPICEKISLRSMKKERRGFGNELHLLDSSHTIFSRRTNYHEQEVDSSAPCHGLTLFQCRLCDKFSDVRGYSAESAITWSEEQSLLEGHEDVSFHSE